MDSTSRPGEEHAVRCPCGVTYSEQEWKTLVLVSDRWDIAGDGIDIVEARNCRACTSTITRPVAA